MASYRSLDDIPLKYRSIFAPIKQFNHVQSEVFDDVIKTNKHIVVSAPTGSGKTKIFELAIVELLIKLEKAECETKNVKIVYVAPTKALCNEVFMMWQQKFQAFDLRVALVTGDSDPMEMMDLNDIAAYQIAVCTPEKWDALTRKWKDHCDIANAVQLMLIDEVHLVGDTFRGPTLEAIVSRTKSFHNQHLRFVSVSASLPNIEDVARWIGAGQPVDSVRRFSIDENERPVKLQRFVRGYVQCGNSFQFAIKLTYALQDIVKKLLSELSQEKQILIFCHSRYDVETTLTQLQKCIQLQLSAIQRSAMEKLVKIIKNEKLRSAVQVGFAFHHAGLPHEDRASIEEAYRNGLIRILFSTNTLATGVNLPAHTVIIKSTERYIQGSIQEVPESMMLQMIGRAGRQQYNTTGRVYIMTKPEKVKYYENFADTVEIESHLNRQLADILNVEIVLGTIKDINVNMMQWLRTTFLYARTCKLMTQNEADAKLKGFCLRAIQMLQSSGLIESKSDGALSALPFGAVMSQYFLSISTMATFQKLTGNETISEILDYIVYCSEFSQFFLRKSDKKFLNDINCGKTGKSIAYPIPGKIQTIPQKVSCLLQTLLCKIPIEDTGLLMEAHKMAQIAERLANSLIDYIQTEQFPRNCCTAVPSSTMLAKSLKTRTWNHLSAFNELNLIEKDVAKLMTSGIDTIESLLNANPCDIELILDKDNPYGSQLINDAAQKLPSYDVEVDVSSGSVVRVRVWQSNMYFDGRNNQNAAIILLVGDSQNHLICYEDIQSNMNNCGSYEKLFTLTPFASSGIVHLIHNGLVGVDKMVSFSTTASITETRTTSYANSEATVTTTNTTTKIAKKGPKPGSIEIATTCGSSASTNQMILPTYFQKVAKPLEFTSNKTSVFDKLNRIISTNTRIVSSDLFATPTQTTNDFEEIYNFNCATNNTQSSCNFDPVNTMTEMQQNQSKGRNVVKSQLLAETPIQRKIVECRAKNQMGGFVRAKEIFNADLNSNENRSISDKNTSNELFDDEFDEEFLALINDEIVELNSPNNSDKFAENRPLIQHLAETAHAFDSGRNAVDDIFSRLPLNKTIRRDFDSIDSGGDDVESNIMRNAIQQSFFSIGEDEANHNIHLNVETKRKTPENTKIQDATITSQSDSIWHSQMSMCSNQAMCGTPNRSEPSPRFATQNVASKRKTVNDFRYVPPSQMASNSFASQNRMVSRVATPTQSHVVKKQKLSIDGLLKNAMTKARTSQPTPHSGLVDVKLERSQKIPKMSSKNIFAKSENKQPTIKPKVDLDLIMEQCAERLKTDVNYKKADFDKDFIRYKILKLSPKTIKKSPLNRIDHHDENSFFFSNDLNMSYRSYPRDDDNDFMNFATPESRTSFF